MASIPIIRAMAYTGTPIWEINIAIMATSAPAILGAPRESKTTDINIYIRRDGVISIP